MGNIEFMTQKLIFLNLLVALIAIESYSQKVDLEVFGGLSNSTLKGI
jgi:hypothetical protein